MMNGGNDDVAMMTWQALWHMEHDDGDAEDLDEAEVRRGLRASLHTPAYP